MTDQINEADGLPSVALIHAVALAMELLGPIAAPPQPTGMARPFATAIRLESDELGRPTAIRSTLPDGSERAVAYGYLEGGRIGSISVSHGGRLVSVSKPTYGDAGTITGFDQIAGEAP